MEATSLTELPPVPPELMEYIEKAETGTLPNPLDDPNVKTLWTPTGRLSFINTVEQNGGQFSLFDFLVLPNGGPPLHFHTLEAEWFYVVDGNPDLQLDNNLIEGSPGTLKFSPVGELHAVKNNTSEPARMLLFYQPVPDDPTAIGNIERFFSAVGQSVDLNNPDVPPPFNPAELVTAAPDYGLVAPSTFVFTARQYTGNEVSILRTGIPDEAASVTLSVGNGLDIPLDFGEGEFIKTIFLPSSLGEQTLDLILKDPSEGAYVGLTANQTELSELDGSNGLVITGTDNDDVLTGANEDDFISGLGGNDILQGLGGRDLILGGSGDDLITGGEDDDNLNGGLDNDTLFGGKNNDLLNGGNGDDWLSGNKGNDTLTGGDGEDILYGGRNNDLLSGDGGNDSLLGNKGDDTLRGGDGNDTLTGGSGSDRFVLAAGDGTDTITDFTSTHDLIELSGGLAFTDLTITQGTSELANDTLLSLTSSDELLAILTGVEASTITSNDFSIV